MSNSDNKRVIATNFTLATGKDETASVFFSAVRFGRLDSLLSRVIVIYQKCIFIFIKKVLHKTAKLYKRRQAILTNKFEHLNKY